MQLNSENINSYGLVLFSYEQLGLKIGRIIKY